MKKQKKYTLLVLVFLYGCATSGFKEFYRANPGATPEVIAATRSSPPPATPIVARTSRVNLDKLVADYSKKGFAIIGTSFFNAGGHQSEGDAIDLAKEVKADLLIIVDPQHTGAQSTVIPITTPTTSTTFTSGTASAIGPKGVVNVYGNGMSTTYGSTTNLIPITINRSDYGALFLVKQRVSLGARFRNLNDQERQELQTNKGVKIETIIDGSPAFNGDLLVGDIIVSFNNAPVIDASSFQNIIRSHAGQSVQISINRQGAIIEKLILLK